LFSIDYNWQYLQDKSKIREIRDIHDKKCQEGKRKTLLIVVTIPLTGKLKFLIVWP
jgi:hypothetical protein